MHIQGYRFCRLPAKLIFDTLSLASSARTVRTLRNAYVGEALCSVRRTAFLRFAENPRPGLPETDGSALAAEFCVDDHAGCIPRYVQRGRCTDASSHPQRDGKAPGNEQTTPEGDGPARLLFPEVPGHAHHSRAREVLLHEVVYIQSVWTVIGENRPISVRIDFIFSCFGRCNRRHVAITGSGYCVWLSATVFRLTSWKVYPQEVLPRFACVRRRGFTVAFSQSSKCQANNIYAVRHEVRA